MKSQGASRKGVILAGGTGTRLHPITLGTNKQLVPVYDKPMIYYPLTTLMLAGISDIVVVSSPDVLPQIRNCLGDGAQWGITLAYAAQEKPEGIAHGLLMAAGAIEGSPITLILGDNIFYRSGLPQQLMRAAGRAHGATIFSVPVSQPERFGVLVLDGNGNPLAIDEKPAEPRSNLAIPGLYFYDDRVFDLARTLRPSKRGELEITDLNRLYLSAGDLFVEPLGRGAAWLDGGTPDDLFEASQFVRVLEQRTGLKISCPEEVAYRMGYIDRNDLHRLVSELKACSYRDYLQSIVEEDT